MSEEEKTEGGNTEKQGEPQQEKESPQQEKETVKQEKDPKEGAESKEEAEEDPNKPKPILTIGKLPNGVMVINSEFMRETEYMLGVLGMARMVVEDQYRMSQMEAAKRGQSRIVKPGGGFFSKAKKKLTRDGRLKFN